MSTLINSSIVVVKNYSYESLDAAAPTYMQLRVHDCRTQPITVTAAPECIHFVVCDRKHAVTGDLLLAYAGCQILHRRLER